MLITASAINTLRSVNLAQIPDGTTSTAELTVRHLDREQAWGVRFGVKATGEVASAQVVYPVNARTGNRLPGSSEPKVEGTINFEPPALLSKVDGGLAYYALSDVARAVAAAAESHITAAEGASEIIASSTEFTGTMSGTIITG